MREVIDSNLRRRIKPDGECDGSNAAIHIKLFPLFLEPAANVRSNETCGGDIHMDEFQSHLPSMCVPGQTQINA